MKISKKITCEKAFMQACKELGLNPKNLPIVDSLPEKDQKSIVAYYKLTIIIRALNEGWEADFSNHNQRKYWNYLWVDYAGFVYAATSATAAAARASVGSRLCFKDYATAQFAIENFKPLYEEYLLIK
jgi:hypothetical protein